MCFYDNTLVFVLLQKHATSSTAQVCLPKAWIVPNVITGPQRLSRRISKQLKNLAF